MITKRNVQYQKIQFPYNKYIFNTSHKRSSINIYSKVQTTKRICIYSHDSISTAFIPTTALVQHYYHLPICSPYNIRIQRMTNREANVFIKYIYIFSIFKTHPLSINIMYWYIFNVRLLFTKNALIDILRGQKALIGNIIVLCAMCVLYNILLFIMP